MSAQATGRHIEQMAETAISPTSTSTLTLNLPLLMGAGQTILTDKGAATASSGAATLNKQSGTITSEALTTAGGATYTLTLTNSLITATSVVTVSLDNGTNTTAPIYVSLVTPSAGQVVIVVTNGTASTALNGTIKIRFCIEA